MGDIPDVNRNPMPIKNDGIGMHDMVIQLLEERKTYGLKKYNTLLQANNSRDALQDLLDELLDAVVYCQQEIVERDMRANRVDGNQKQIVDELRELGFSVLLLNSVKGGCPDLLVALDGISLLVEIKTDEGKLNELEEKFFDTWKGEITVARNVEEILDKFNYMRGLLC